VLFAWLWIASLFARDDGGEEVDYLTMERNYPGATSGSVRLIVVPLPGTETIAILPPSCCVTRL